MTGHQPGLVDVLLLNTIYRDVIRHRLSYPRGHRCHVFFPSGKEDNSLALSYR